MAHGDSLFGTRTSTLILEGLKDAGNDVLWREFDGRYRPLVVGYLCTHGLSHDQAEEVAQRTLIEFARAYRAGKYDREKGRLRKWLFGIVTNQMRSHRRQQARIREINVVDRSTQTGFLQRVPDEDELEQRWNQEYLEHFFQDLLARARVQFDPQTIDAFTRYALNDEPVETVARDLEMTNNAIYLVKHRVIKWMKDNLDEM